MQNDFLSKIKPKVIGVQEVEGIGTVHIRNLSLSEVEAIDKAYRDKDEVKALALSVLYGVAQPDGTRMLADDQLPEIMAAESTHVVKLAEAVSKTIAELRPKVEDAKKN